MLMERKYISKSMFDVLVDLIGKVFDTFKPDEFPENTKEAVNNLKNYLDKTFLREAVSTGSDEYSAAASFSEGLQENCIEGAIFAGRDFVEARKTFRNEVFLFKKALGELEKHPVQNWLAFKTLAKIAPAWEK